MEWQEERRRQSQGGGQKPEEGCPGAGVKEENREVWDPKWYGRPRSLWAQLEREWGLWHSEQFSQAALLHWHGQVQGHAV